MAPGNSVALVAVTGSGLSNAIAQSELSLTIVLSVVGLGLVHMLMGVGGLYWLERHGSRRQLHLHFALATLVGVTAVALSHGTAWLLLLSLVSQSVLYLERRGVLLVSGAAGAVVLASMWWFRGDTTELFEMLVGCAAAFLFVLFFSRMALEQHRARHEVERLADQLAQANRRLQVHADQVEELSAARERNRIAREIHDGLGHYLTVVHVQLEAAQATLSSKPDAALAALGRAQQFTHEGLEEVRRSVSVLRGSSLPRPLVESLGRLTDECVAGGLPVSLEVDGPPRTLADPIEFTLYRTAQEALTNVRRHARASRVTVELSFRAPDVVRLAVADDGVGADDTAGGFGLVGLRERAELVGGTLALRSDGGGAGFTLELEVPG